MGVPPAGPRVTIQPLGMKVWWGGKLPAHGFPVPEVVEDARHRASILGGDGDRVKDWATHFTRIPAGWPSSFELWVDFEDPEGLWALQWKPTENRVTTSHPLRRLGFYLWCFNWKKHEIKSISKMSRTFPSSKESSESWNSFHSDSSCFPPRKVNPLKSCLVGTPVGNQQTYQTWVYSSAWVTGWS